MYDEKAALLGGIIALVVFGIILIIACVICKFCMTSRKVQRWSGLDKLFARNVESKHSDDTIYSKSSVSHESIMLKIQQGDYVGYDTLERDISITKLPTSVSKEGLEYEISTPANVEKSVEVDDAMDMSKLKSAPETVKHNGSKNVQHSNRPAAPPPRRHSSVGSGSHTFHNNYTIYEETSSDLSGNDEASTAKRANNHKRHHGNHSPHLMEDSSGDDVSSCPSDSESTLTHSDSCQSFGSSMNLLECHIEDSGLGQVEYSLKYNRENCQLLLHIIQARSLELPCNASGELPDTFIKTFATDCHDHNPKKQTKICKSTANPIFKENFFFRVDVEEFSSATVTLQIFSRDHYARQRLVGEIVVELSPLCCTDNYRTWSNILDYDHQPLGSCAELEVGLRYDPLAEELKVSLTRLKTLKLEASPVYTFRELFVAVTLFVNDTHPKIKKKTSTASIATTSHSCHMDNKALLFPHMHHSMLHDSKLLIELCQQYPNNSHETMGYAILGAGTSDTEYGHWLLVDSNNTKQEPITMWHNIHHLNPSSKHKLPRLNLR